MRLGMAGLFLVFSMMCSCQINTAPELIKNQWAFFEALDEYGKQLGKEYNLEFLLSSLENPVRGENFAFAMIFMGRQKLQEKDAANLAKEIHTKIWNRFEEDPVYLNYIRSMEEKHKKISDQLWPPRPEHFAFKISFWDEEMDRRKPPYVAQVIVVDGKLKIFYAGEGDFLEEPKIEKLSIESE